MELVLAWGNHLRHQVRSDLRPRGQRLTRDDIDIVDEAVEAAYEIAYEAVAARYREQIAEAQAAARRSR